jgi:hypothetical protein
MLIRSRRIINIDTPLRIYTKFRFTICLFAVLLLSFKPQAKIFTDLQEALKTPNNVAILKLNGCYTISNGQELESITLLKNLQSLEISECSTVKALPECITSLTHLKKLTFSWNGGSGEAINWSQEYSKISKLKQLEILVLGPYNNLGDLSPKVCELASLKILDLKMTETTSLPINIIELKNLEEMDLSMTILLKQVSVKTILAKAYATK